MLRLSSLILRVVHKQTAASSSTRPERTGQHSLATGSPRPMCTNPPRRSTQAPSFNVSIGHVAEAGGGGQGVPTGGLFTGGVTTGGTVIGGLIMGGTVMGGTVTGGLTMGGTVMGGTVMGGLTMGGTTGGKVIGGLTMGGTTGGTVIGGLTMGGRVMGGFPLGGLWWEGGLWWKGGLCWGGGLEQGAQPRIGVAEEMKSVKMRNRAESLEESMMVFRTW